jgi:hypothetical protein
MEGCVLQVDVPTWSPFKFCLSALQSHGPARGVRGVLSLLSKSSAHDAATVCPSPSVDGCDDSDTGKADP